MRLISLCEQTVAGPNAKVGYWREVVVRQGMPKNDSQLVADLQLMRLRHPFGSESYAGSRLI